MVKFKGVSGVQFGEKPGHLEDSFDLMRGFSDFLMFFLAFLLHNFQWVWSVTKKSQCFFKKF